MPAIDQQKSRTENQATALIPARLASVRFPGKPLAAQTGKPLIRHVVENAQRCDRLSRIVVATDDARIADAVRAFGGEAVMTGEHPNGTSRLAEAIRVLDPSGPPDQIIVNVQGDEPDVPPSTIAALVDGLASDPEAPMATLASPFDPADDPADPNLVKVIADTNGRALYFSRALIPLHRDRSEATPKRYKHPGLYAYRRWFLDLYPSLAPTPLEQAEKLEQLRVLEHGYAIRLIEAPAPHPGIDTPEQYAAFVRRVRAG